MPLAQRHLPLIALLWNLRVEGDVGERKERVRRVVGGVRLHALGRQANAMHPGAFAEARHNADTCN
jgi:hypothetical protein